MKAGGWRQVTPYRVEIREGGGCLSIFGLPFFAAGIFMFLTLMGIVPMGNSDASATRIVLPLMAVAFTGVGGMLVFGRVLTAIDRADCKFERQWRLLVPLRTQTARLGDCVAVVVGFSAGDSDSADQFPVELKSRTDRARKIYSASSYAEARACATTVARLLNVDVEDATTDHAVRVPASNSELSLAERLRVDGRDEASEPRPSSMRSEVRSEGSGIHITIPAAPAHPFLIAATLIPVVIVVALFGPFNEFFHKTKTPDPIGWVFLGFFAFLFAGLPGITVLNAILRSRWGATIVTVSKDGIRIAERGAWRTTTTGDYAAADIFDLDFSTSESEMASARHIAIARAREADAMARPTPLSPGMERVLTTIVSLTRNKGITLKTRRGLISFGAGLDEGEICYLAALIRRTLASK